MLYIQKKDSDTWHWAGNCSNLPKNAARVQECSGKRRPRGDLCNQCLSKERRGKSRPIHTAARTSSANAVVGARVVQTRASRGATHR